MRNNDDATSATKDAFGKASNGISPGNDTGKKGEEAKRTREKRGSPNGTSSNKNDDGSKQRGSDLFRLIGCENEEANC